MGRYKYDSLCLNVVIELWSEETQQLVARIRVDENSHPEVIEELERRCGEFRFAADDELSPPTHHYRVGVYLNGFSVPMGGGVLEDVAFVYYPEGDTDQYNLIINIPVFFDYGNGVSQLGMRGSKSIAEETRRCTFYGNGSFDSSDRFKTKIDLPQDGRPALRGIPGAPYAC